MPTAVSDWPVLETGLCRLRPARQSDLSALKAAVMDSRFPAELNLAKMAREGRLGEWLAGLLGQEHLPRLWSITASDADAALARPGYTRVVAMIAPNNLPSIATVLRSGFTKPPSPSLPVAGMAGFDAYL